ncbi:MAG: nucleoside-diphosphate kinase [Spirochaetaceae bacterium]|jgi:nucleoside diphosphate kinase|nr:nucleoside-diphosphate kinase [Spirochaetaceae bacterium]
MSEALSYVLVTPYTVAKSRTGGVISRLLSQTDLELAGAQLFAPDRPFAARYAAVLRAQAKGETSLLADYVEQNFAAPDGAPLGGRAGALFLLFRGADPCKKLAAVCGHMHPEHRSGLDEVRGQSIRDTYADLILAPDNSGKCVYFEPAVITPRDQPEADANLKLFLPLLQTSGNVIGSARHANPAAQRTLVIIKPDNWSYASARPGSIIDMFSRTGLRIIGVKIHRFSLEEALDFYGPVETALTQKLAPVFGKKARALLEREFGLPLSDAVEQALTGSFGAAYARDQFEQIVEFMSGHRPGKPETRQVKCMIVIYEGEDAIGKIRGVLGPTDPLKAPAGTIRREFGSNVMVNTAHASDAPESFEREQAIVKIHENTAAAIIAEYLGSP